MTRPVHSMIRVLDLDRSIAFYRTALGLEVADRYDFDTFTLVYLRGQGSDFELELTSNHGNESPYDLGDGYGHLAVTVDDAAVERGRLESAGLEPESLEELEHGGELLGRYFFLTDPDGYRIEVLERAGRFA